MRRELHVRDWPFGALGRRLLLEALFLDSQPADGWTKRALEKRADVGPGGLDEVLAGAVALGLVERHERRWRRARKLPPIAKPLKQLVAASAVLPDTPIPSFPKRPYTKS